MDLAGGRIVDGDLVDGRPEDELLGLHPLELLDAALFDVAVDLGVVAHELADHLEAVLDLGLLQDPHVAAAPDEAHLDDVLQRQEPQRQPELLQQERRQLHALLVPLPYDAALFLSHGSAGKLPKVRNVTDSESADAG